MSLIGALGGVTIKEAIELCRLTMARDASLTASGLMRTRKTFFHGHSGLTQVDAAQAFYDPPGPLVAYSKREKPFFLGETDNRLVPRGILLDGPPGTGKTAGAKYIAEQWGVPLYRVDIGGTKSKWLGESEAHMLNNLNRLDQEQPCVVLFDEMEKMFANQHDSGTTSAMMGQLLWWLAEHQSRVFTVMTTNARKKLPPEVYREGRIDEVFVFEGLEEGDAVGFVANVLATFKVKATAKIIDPIIKAVYAHETGRVSQAALTKASYVAVKALTKPVLPDDE